MSMSYGLVWRDDSHRQPQPDSRIALTVAGLRYVSGSAPLVGAFLATMDVLREEVQAGLPDD